MTSTIPRWCIPTRKFWKDGYQQYFDEKSIKGDLISLDQTDAGETWNPPEEGNCGWANKNVYKREQDCICSLSMVGDNTYIKRAVVDEPHCHGQQGKMPVTGRIYFRTFLLTKYIRDVMMPTR